MKQILFIFGILLTLSGATLMIEDGIFGERTINAAIVLGIIGICLIATYSPWKTKIDY